MKPASINQQASLLRDAVFASSDGIITTFAVVAGSQGASLAPRIVLILGFANLFADGISMAAGNYLGTKSAQDLKKANNSKSAQEAGIYTQAGVTFGAFVAAGLLPLIPFVFGMEHAFATSFMSVGAALFFVGSLRSHFTKKSWVRSGFESLLVGGIAAVVAYGIGYAVEQYVL